MMVGITGTPGTGKSSAGDELARRGYSVIRLVDTLRPYILERDAERDTLVADEEEWAKEFPPVEGIVEGHLAHYLSCDQILILRCRPDILSGRLRKRGYEEEKIQENMEAEALDVILQEVIDRFSPSQIYEVDATTLTTEEVADIVEEVVTGTRNPSYGSIDWSGYLQEAP
ncbi:MAG: adenylate kinase family protein [Methanomicrobiales archaeon]|nr:adenylate kinase family protein [Methanomicrobiales archaeon]